MFENKQVSKAIIDVLSGPAVLFDRPGPYFSYIPSGTSIDYLTVVTEYIESATGQIKNESAVGIIGEAEQSRSTKP